MLVSVFHLLKPVLFSLALPVPGLLVQSRLARDLPPAPEQEAAAPAGVPEPDVTSLVGGLGALMLLRRRR